MISGIIIQLMESKSRIMDYKSGKLDFEINLWNQIHVWISIPVCANLKSLGGIKFAFDFDSSVRDFEINWWNQIQVS
jgi:hypothetical protein